MMRSLPWLVAPTLALALLLPATAPAAEAAAPGLVRSEPPPMLEALHGRLVDAEARLVVGEAAAAAEKARKVARKVMGEAWHDPRAIALLAECALVQAVAEAISGDAAAAAWHYAMAIATDPAIAERDLDAFGAPAVALVRAPRRVAERPPPGVTVADLLDPRVKRPRLEDLDGYGLRNDGAFEEPPPSVVVEVLIDENGTLSQPLSLTPSHPIAVYHVLETLRTRRAEPASRGGEPVAVLYVVTVDLDPVRW